MSTERTDGPTEVAEATDRIRELAAQLRVDSLRASSAAGSGHPTSSLSAADLMAVLLARYLRWDLDSPDDPNRDHLIFSKGHASPLLYSMLKSVGAISDDELLSFRRLRSRLQGHPVPSLPGIDVATGSLGQGLPIGVGIALAGKALDKLAYRVWVLVGDSEMSEGAIWEAFAHARHYKLGNLIAILDMNRLGQRGETPLGWNSAAYAARARAFGWRAIEVDGHEPEAIARAYDEAVAESDAPAFVIARTIKGKGVSLVENKGGWHGKALTEEECAKAVAELGGVRSIVVKPRTPSDDAPASPPAAAPIPMPRYERGASVATRKAYGDALAAVGASRTDVVALDAEVNNSTCASAFAKAHPERYFEMFIAEQQMVAAAVGLSVREKIPFASTFAAFFTRAYDFVRMAAVSEANVKLCGSHAGVSIGEDGPSQMGLEDLAMMRAVHGSRVLYPCCANQTAKLVVTMADEKGMFYLRTTREKTPVLYDAADSFPLGGSKVLRQSPSDAVTIVAAGITVREALAAHERLSGRGLSVRVVDAYSVKPIDAATIRASVQATRGNVVVVEDHWAEGGLGDAVLECLGGEEPVPARVVHLAVRDMPGSGTSAEQLAAAGIDAAAIVKAAQRLASAPAEARPSARRCFVCGRPAAWRIAVAGEDEPRGEEDACELHAKGHQHLAGLGGPPRPSPDLAAHRV